MTVLATAVLEPGSRKLNLFAPAAIVDIASISRPLPRTESTRTVWPSSRRYAIEVLGAAPEDYLNP